MTVAGDDHAAPVSGVILAAGASARMGRAKQVLPLGGAPILQHVIDAAAQSRLGEIILVVGGHADETLAGVRLPLRARAVRNPDYAEGIASSLIAGVRTVSADAGAIAVLLGDEPAVRMDLIDLVLDVYARATRPIARAVYVGGDGARTAGHPVILARSVWPAIERLHGDQGMRGIIAAHPDWMTEVDIREEAPFDIDTWDDYERVKEQYRRRDRG